MAKLMFVTMHRLQLCIYMFCVPMWTHRKVSDHKGFFLGNFLDLACSQILTDCLNKSWQYTQAGSILTTCVMPHHLYRTDCDDFFKCIVRAVHCKEISGVRLSVQDIHHNTARYILCMSQALVSIKHICVQSITDHRMLQVHALTEDWYIWIVLNNKQ